MQHNPTFDLRETLARRRREARFAALACAALAIVAAIGAGIFAAREECQAAAVLGLITAAAAVAGVAVAGRA